MHRRLRRLLRSVSFLFRVDRRAERLKEISIRDGPTRNHKNEPDRCFNPSVKSSGCSSGSCMVSRISALTWARPPTSSQETEGIFGAPMLSEYDARAFPSANSKSEAVMEIPAEKTSYIVPLLPDYQRESAKLKMCTHCSFVDRRIDAAFARATRSTRSAATSAAVCTARSLTDTSGASVQSAKMDRRISCRSNSPGAYEMDEEGPVNMYYQNQPQTQPRA